MGTLWRKMKQGTEHRVQWLKSDKCLTKGGAVRFPQVSPFIEYVHLYLDPQQTYGALRTGE